MKILGKEIKLTNTVIIGVLIGIILLLVKCNGDKISKLKQQNLKQQNNIEVLNDSVKSYYTKNGNLIHERGVLISNKKELKELNNELYEEVKELEKTIPNSNQQLVVKYITKIQSDTVYVNSNILMLNDSTYVVNFKKDTVFSKNNSRHLEGSLTIDLFNDTTKFKKLNVSKVKITKDIINMDASLVLGMMDKKLKVWLKTDYPGFEASQIDAVVLDPNIHPELRKLNKKKFSVGPHVGIGIGENLSISPTIGIGIQYSLIKF